MRTREPVPDRMDGGEHPEREPPAQLPGLEHELWSGPSLTIAEAARTCGVSVSTIRRHLAAGRFPTAHQRPSPIPGQRGLWHIPTQDLVAAGLRPGQDRRSDQEQMYEPSSGRTAGQPVDDRVRELEHALELERARRRAAEDLAAERAHTIWTWRAHWRRYKHITPPRRPTPTAPLPRQRHHPTPPIPPASPPTRHVADGAEAKAGQARTQPRGESGHHRAGAQQATATQAARALTARSQYQVDEGHWPPTSRGEGTRSSHPMASFRSRGQIHSPVGRAHLPDDRLLLDEDHAGLLHVDEVLRMLDGRRISGEFTALPIASSLSNQSSPIPSQIGSLGAATTRFCTNLVTPGTVLRMEVCCSLLQCSRHCSRVMLARRCRTKITFAIVSPVKGKRCGSYWSRLPLNRAKCNARPARRLRRCGSAQRHGGRIVAAAQSG
jgi:hypothetical protein